MEVLYPTFDVFNFIQYRLLKIYVFKNIHGNIMQLMSQILQNGISSLA